MTIKLLAALAALSLAACVDDPTQDTATVTEVTAEPAAPVLAPSQPAEGVTSLLCAGLPDCGMDYDDLILSLMADRLDFLFTHRQEAVAHILDLLKSSPSGSSSAANMQAAMKQPEKRVPAVTAVDMQILTRPANDTHRQGAPAAVAGPCVD